MQKNRKQVVSQVTPPRHALAAAALLTLAAMPVYGASRTWDTNAAGNWTDATNWVDDIDYANGADETATFGNFISADRIVTLDAPITIGNITASDTSHNYTISGANVLTLDRTDATKPTINVTTSNRTLTISSQIAGNDGLLKTGAGTLSLNGNNTFSGDVEINGGTLLAANSNALGSGNNVVFTGSGTLSTAHSAYPVFTQGVTINNGVTATLNPGSQFYKMTFNGVLAGSGTLNFTTGSGGAGSDLTFTNVGNTFTGLVKVVMAGNAGGGLTVNSLADSANAIQLTGNANSAIFKLGSGAASPLLFNNRQIELNGTGAGGGTIQNNNASNANTITINTDLLVSATGNKTLTLGGTNTGVNTFGGDIANGTGAVISLTKTDGGIWALGGTNTYSGDTNLAASGTTGRLIFQGSQALSPNTTLKFAQASSSVQSVSFLDDGAGTINFNRPIEFGGSNTLQNLNILVGNNNTANGGSSAGTTTGSTIQVGNITFTSVAGDTNTTTINATSPNGYRLQTGTITLNNLVSRAAGQTTVTALNPTTANMTVAAITMAAGNAGPGADGIPTLRLTGTALDNIVTGAISESSVPLPVQKQGNSMWTLEGTNTYTGGTTISAGTLRFSGATSIPTTGTVSVAAGGNLSLADGTARSSTVPALSLTSLAGLTFDWTGSGTGDTLTSTADITPTANSKFAITLNRSGTPAGPLTLLDGGAGSTLSSSQFYLANATDYTATLSTPTADTLVVDNYASATPLTTFYWVGNKLAAAATAGVDNAWALSDGTKSNWSSTTTAYTATALTPGATADVIFANGQVGKTQQSTTLVADVTVNSLTIDDSVAVTVAGPGTTLTLLSSSSTPGTVSTPGSAISVTSNANATSTISSAVQLGSNQTWNVASGKTLAVSGSVNGDFSLTKGSAGTLTLTGTNSYTGGTFINAGTVNASAINLGGPGSNITFGGSATLNISATSVFGALAVNSGTATFGTSNVTRSFTSTTGSGDITFSGANNSTGVLDLGNASAFTGNLRNDIGGTGNLPTKTLQFTSLGDAGSMRFGGGDGNGSQSVRYRLYGDAGPLTMTNRQLQLLTRTSSSNDLNRALLQNDNVDPANKWVISPDLINTLRRSSTLELRGTNTGDNEFAGALINSTDAGAYALNLAKVDAGKWILSDANNTFTGAITFGQQITGSDTRASSNGTLAYASAGGTNPITFNLTTGSATLSYIGSTDKTMSGAISAGTLTTGTITLDSSGTGAVNYSNAASLGTAGSGNKNLVLSGTSTGSNTLAGAWNDNTGGAATVTKNDAGTWVLAGTNNYTGATTVNAGTLLVNGSLTATSGVTVASGATLGGNGSINAPVTLDSTTDKLSPGNSPGTLSFGVNQNWVAYSYDWEINDWTDTVAGTDFDQIALPNTGAGTGTLDLTGATANSIVLNILSLKNDNSSGLVGIGGNTFTETNRSWTIIAATSVSGFEAGDWQINASGFQDTEGGTWSVEESGGNINLVYTAVPEPTTLGLLATGAIGLLRRRRVA